MGHVIQAELIFYSNIGFCMHCMPVEVKMILSYLIKVAFPVNGPNLISANGGLKPSMLNASS